MHKRPWWRLRLLTPDDIAKGDEAVELLNQRIENPFVSWCFKTLWRGFILLNTYLVPVVGSFWLFAALFAAYVAARG